MVEEIHRGELLGFIEPTLQLWHCALCDTYWTEDWKYPRRVQTISREDP